MAYEVSQLDCVPANIEDPQCIAGQLMGFPSPFCHAWDAACANLDTVHLYRPGQQVVALRAQDVMFMHGWGTVNLDFSMLMAAK